jgi:hypothetical protein
MKLKNIYIVIISLSILFSCEKDAEFQPKEYLYPVTLNPKINDKSAEFFADITNLNDQKIIKFGFVWSKNQNPSLEDFKTFIDDIPKKGIYSCIVNSGFVKGEIYYVRAYILTDKYEVYGNEKSFTSNGSLPPVIESFDPKYGPIGAQITIKGRNFATSVKENQVKFGQIEVPIDSAFENRLVVTIPKITKSYKVPVTVKTAGMSATSKDSFDLWFPWLQKKDFEIGFDAVGFSLGNLGYVINSKSTFVYTYDPVSDKWDNKLQLPENSGRKPMAFSINNKAYVLLENNFWEFDPSTNYWIKKKKFPGVPRYEIKHVFGFKINNSVYIGNCYYNYDFWEYNTTQDMWYKRANFIGNFADNSPVFSNYSFTLNNCGFLGISQTSSAINTLWKYDPLNNKWSRKSPLPSDAYDSYFSIQINEDAYVGLGINFELNDGYVSNKVWKYDSQNDLWIKYFDFPVRAAVYANFTIDKKGYIITGYTIFDEPLYNIWEFDPSKE